jgi:protein-tyrosine phosphatase
MWLIRERLYLGDYHAGEQALAGAMHPVLPEGVLAPFAGVVSLCSMQLFSDSCPEDPAAALTEWLQLPIEDGGNGEEEFEGALNVALPFIRRRMQQGNVLIHCAAGMSRSVSIIAALLCEEGLELDAAYETIARTKARALAIAEAEHRMLIAPAPEFRACLRRLYRAASKRTGLGRRQP